MRQRKGPVLTFTMVVGGGSCICGTDIHYGCRGSCVCGTDIHYGCWAERGSNVCVTMQVTSGDHLNGPEGVEISMLPAENGSADSNIRHTYTVTEGRYTGIRTLTEAKVCVCNVLAG